MRRIKHFWLLFLVTILAMTIASSVIVASAEGTVSISTIDAWKFGGGRGIDSSYTSNGVLVEVPGADTVGSGDAWSYKAKIPNDNSMMPAFSIADGQSVIIEISVKLFDSDGNQVSKSQNSDALDIYIHDASNESQVGLLRIWTGSGSAKNGNHSCQVMGSDWNDKGARLSIMGDATAESKFTIKFDKENFISSYVGGQDGLVPLGKDEIIADRKEALKNVDKIYFKIGGDNGFTNSTEITVRSINGQSLANVEGNFTDTVAPVFLPANVSQTLNAGEEYTIPTEAHDLLGNVTYSLKIGENTIEGKKFTPNEPGEMKITLVATDAAGNSSEKEYTFNVVATIAEPTIKSVPTIESKTVSYFESIVFDAPEYEDETGTGTVVLKIAKGEDEITLQQNESGKFVYLITSDFVAGDYTFVYEVENSAGSVSSDPQTVAFAINEVNRADFITAEMTTKMLAQYLSSGIHLRSLIPWAQFSLGEFDISEGLDVKFIVKPTTINGATNDAVSVEIELVNADDNTYRVMYRVWVSHSGADCATNVYISTNGGDNYTDITDTGWISRMVDDVEGQYHMSFNMEDTFVGERTGGMTRVDKAYEQLVAFFESCPSNKFVLYMDAGNWADSGNQEIILTELNGQSFVGDEITWNNAYLSVKTDIPSKIVNGSSLSISAYAKDIRGDVTLNLSVVAPDGTTENLTIEDGAINYTFSQLGEYKLTISTIGLNNEKVEESFVVVAKSEIAPIVITLDGEYEATYDQNSSVTILPVTYSENVVNSSITILRPSGESVTVAVGDTFTFANPGIYVITYSGQDNAQPTVNENSVAVTINVYDTKNPEISVNVSEKATVGESIIPEITVSDDSECDVTVSLEKPDGTSIKLDSSNKYEFTPEEEGSYTLKIVAEFGVTTLVITLGERGAVCFSNGAQYKQEALSIDAIDTTAAGDTFVGTLASGIAKGINLQSSLKYSTVASALACCKRGAQCSIPSYDEVRAYAETMKIDI